MATRADLVDVTNDAWAAVLTAGKSATLENKGPADVYLMTLTTAPDRDDGVPDTAHLLEGRTWGSFLQVTTGAGETLYATSAHGASSLAVTDHA